METVSDEGVSVNTIEIAYMLPRIGHQSNGFGYGLLGQRRLKIVASDIGAILGHCIRRDPGRRVGLCHSGRRVLDVSSTRFDPL